MCLEKLSFGDLVDRSEECPGREVYFLKLRIISSYHIFFGNSKELRKLLVALKSPSSAPLRWEKKRQEHEIIMREVGRLLHNYACGIESLGSHVRAIVRKAYPRGELREEYESKVAKTFHSSFAQFMQDLRDWVTHRGMLPFGDRVHIELDQGKVIERTAGIVFDIADLREWKGWKAESRQYLQSEDADRLDVLTLVEEYDTLVNRFYGWLEGTIEKTHKSELTEFRSLVKEIGRRTAERDSKGPSPK